MSPTKVFFAALPLSLLLAAQALAQCEIQRITPPPQETTGKFGNAVQINDRHLIVGDYQGDTPCAGICSTGAVYAHRLDASSGRWIQTQLLHPFDIAMGDAFGWSVHLDGDRMIVGATHADIAGGDTGGAYIYEFVEDQWVETARLGSPEPHFMATFGRNVHLDGDVALVMQYTQDVFVYEETASGWVLRDTLTPPDEPGGSPFGDAIALTDEWLILGAHADRSLGNNVGSIYIYRRDGLTDFAFVQKIDAPDPENTPRFGNTIACDGRTLAVGGYIADRTYEGQGAVYIFELEDGRWTYKQDFTHAEPTRGDFFGVDLAMQDDVIVVGASRMLASPAGDGAAFEFKRSSDGQWRESRTLIPEGGSSRFGISVALFGSKTVAGGIDEYVDGRRVGAAHVFDLSCIECPADTDGDGFLTVFDFLLFFNLFDDGDARADFDGDGELTIFDFLAFQDAFDAGCA